MVGYKAQILALALAGVVATAPQPSLTKRNADDLANGFWDDVGGGMHSAVDEYVAVCRAPFAYVTNAVNHHAGIAVRSVGGGDVCNPNSASYAEFDQQLDLIIQQTTPVTLRIEAIRQHPPTNGQLPDFNAEIQPIVKEYNQVYDLIGRSPEGQAIRNAHATAFNKFDQCYHGLSAAAKGY